MTKHTAEQTLKDFFSQHGISHCDEMVIVVTVGEMSYHFSVEVVCANVHYLGEELYLHNDREWFAELTASAEYSEVTHQPTERDQWVHDLPFAYRPVSLIEMAAYSFNHHD